MRKRPDQIRLASPSQAFSATLSPAAVLPAAESDSFDFFSGSSLLSGFLPWFIPSWKASGTSFKSDAALPASLATFFSASGPSTSAPMARMTKISEVPRPKTRRATGEAAGGRGAAAVWPHPVGAAALPRLSLGPARAGAAKAKYIADWTRHVAAASSTPRRSAGRARAPRKPRGTGSRLGMAILRLREQGPRKASRGRAGAS
mmetsp:Transcript_86705/g.234983  ORF Transcript_86705/g.234983 Transcript_86705/m.234983 type:complete len:203 (-) Transcript_86705:18-626(-)